MTTWYRSRLLFALALASASPGLAQSISVKDATGNPITIRVPNANGRAAATNSAPVTLSSEDLAAINGLLKPGQSVLLGGTLPAFASPPTFNLGTAPSLTLTNSTFGASQVGGWTVGLGTADAANLNATATSNASIAAATGTKADASSTATDTTPASVIALTKGLIVTLTTLNSKIDTLSGKIDTLHADNQQVPASLPPLSAGSAAIGSITNAAFGISGPLPAGTNPLGTVGVTAVPNPTDVTMSATLATGTVGTYAQFATAGAGTVAVEVTNLPAGAVLNVGKVVGGTAYSSTAILAGGGNAAASTIGSNGVYHIIAGGAAMVRLTVATAATGTANLSWLGTASAEMVGVRQSQPANLYASAVTDSRINDGAGNLLGVQYAAINASAAGNNTIVAAVAGKRLRVLGFFILAGANNTLTWQDGATTTLSGPLPFLANQGQNAATTPYGQFATSAGNALVLNLSTAAAVTGYLSYVTY